MSLPETDVTRDAVIQRFEFTYELAWKTMKQWLFSKDIDVRNPKDTLRVALQQGLINDGNGWTRLHDNQNLTAHTYDEGTASRVYAFIQSEGVVLFKTLLTQLEKTRIEP